MAEDDLPLADLDAASAVWVQLSSLVNQARVAGDACATNDELRKRVEAGGDDFAPAYLLWLGDNLSRSKRSAEAVAVYAEHADRFGAAKFGDRLWGPIALENLARTQVAAGQPKDALATYSGLLDGPTDGSSRAWIALHAARVAEDTIRDTALALQWYDRAVGETDDPSQYEIPVADLAKREAARLRSDHPWICDTMQELAARLALAVRKPDAAALGSLASATHMRVGVAGSEVRFVDAERTIELLVEHFSGGALCDPSDVTGHGDKRYLAVVPATPGSPYALMHLMLCRCSLGWEWAGVIWTLPDDALTSLMPSGDPMTNQPLPNPFLRAPWPAGISFKAGGVLNFGAEALAVASIPFGWLLALGLSNGPAGWGPAGFYYNQFGHTGSEQAFAIDFTRYQQHVPLVNAAGGTPVLCVSAGVVQDLEANRPNGDPLIENRIATNHVVTSSDWTPAALTGGDTRLRAKYLHLAGPHLIPWSLGMFVPRGIRLGLMDDTGLSAFDHLHFSVHDQNLGFQSVRINPLDGQRLDDGDNYSVVHSTNGF
ncbi:hypothetical protein ACPPVT_02320 [Angustibacter sp. McL0619]|uniref:hypothetical protein n=1 Tax=Angustibacter sp. McL0619 TaxID=3415676 RepID=UPI003CF5D3EF